MNLLQINTVGNIGSTGRIAEQIGIEAMRKGWKSYIACARAAQSKSEIIRIGSKWHRYPNVLWTRIFDSDSPLAKTSTLKLINDIKKISPDVIHLHNLHGYYLHTPTLLEFLGEYGNNSYRLSSITGLLRDNSHFLLTISTISCLLPDLSCKITELS